MNLYENMIPVEPKGVVLSPKDRLDELCLPLLAWYQENKRDLPWRQNPTAYHVWVSEIMLQQTRVDAVKGYYARFLETLPDIAALAQAPEDQLLKLWEGLGYYNRVKNLKKAAIQVMELWDGDLPADYEALLRLPGIGAYTAGAIASIAFGIPAPAVDGNVLRVVARLTEDNRDIGTPKVKKAVESLLKDVIPKENPGEYNQALMEIGAVVCIPNGAPRCRDCPLSGLCLANKKGLTDKIPFKAPKAKRRVEKKTVLLVTCKERLLLQKRPDQGLLSGLYELPSLEGHLSLSQVRERLLEEPDIARISPLPPAKHIFSHVEWDMIGYQVELRTDSGKLGLLIEKERLKRDYALPSAFQYFLTDFYKEE